jgi:hypothetical protein
MGDNPFTPGNFLLPLGEGSEDEGFGVMYLDEFQ